MLIKLKRIQKGKVSTIGELSVNGEFLCFTLEDLVRVKKVQDETAIPKGTYNVSLTHSSKFGRVMPSIENVPGFTGVRIHKGNTANDTEGCVLVGMKKMTEQIYQCQEAFDKVYGLIQETLGKGEKVLIEITEVIE